MIDLKEKTNRTLRPLDVVKMKLTEGIHESVSVYDGYGKEYFSAKDCKEIEFVVGGGLGMHRIDLSDHKGNLIHTKSFKVNCATEVKGDHYFERLFSMIDFTMKNEYIRHNLLIDNKMYSSFICWCRDHVHSLKGRKYFEIDYKSGIELYHDFQRQDGMIWDHIYPGTEPSFRKNFKYGGFYKELPDGQGVFKRIPVEADVEYLYVEGVYYTWKAYGDDFWMESMLESCLKALDYSMNDPYRWSEKYQLIKRGYTIDTWDFVSKVDEIPGTHSGVVYLDQSEFGIMFGDNTGYAASCRYLAEMYECTGNAERGDMLRKRADMIMENLDKAAWTNGFYKHHVPENESFDRSALGVNENEQVSLSNTYSINRGIDYDKRKAIIETYKRLKENLPEGCPGEWFTIYPPFENFNGMHSFQWEYMNAGVITIAAGELAHGAFENGEEWYGLDILKRIKALGEKHGGYLHCTYKGKNPVKREHENFATLDISAFTNARCDIEVDGGEGIKGEQAVLELYEVPSGEQVFLDVPFSMPVPNGEVQNAVALGHGSKALHEKINLSTNRKFESIYLLHAMNNADCAGYITFCYEDGSNRSIYMKNGQQVMNWYDPKPGSWPDAGGKPYMQPAWLGENSVCDRVGLTILGLDNPCPDKIVNSIKFHKQSDHAHWYLFGITLSDDKAWMDLGDVSFGIPDAWGAAALAYAYVEGLAGVVDKATVFNKAEVSPRWMVTDADDIAFSVRYPVSDGYVSYKYHHSEDEKLISYQITGSGEEFRLRILLPKDMKAVKEVLCNGKPIEYSIEKVDYSIYACIDLLAGVNQVFVRYS